MTDSPASLDSDSLNDTPGPVRRFQLELFVLDFEKINVAAVRHGVGCPPSTFHVTVNENELIWKFSEANVVTWFTQSNMSETLFTGNLTLPVHFFEAIDHARVDSEDTMITLDIDLDANTLAYVAPNCRISTTLPEQTDPPVVPDWTRTSRIFFNSSLIAHIASFLASDPVGTDEEDFDGVAPFVQCSFDGNEFVLTRDWTPHGGPVLTASFEAGGNFRGSFSLFARVFSREIYLADVYATGLVAIEFNEAEPHVCRIGSSNWGLAVQLGFEHIFEYRRSLEMSLMFSDAELEVERDDRIGWDPVVVVTAGSRTVHATLTPGQNGVGHYVRLSTDIASDIPWSDALGVEVNAWNDRWPSVKLVHADGVLRAIADMPVSAMPAMADAVVDLTEKAQVVDDLIAAVL